jgi:hypothetical protein
MISERVGFLSMPVAFASWCHRSENGSPFFVVEWNGLIGGAYGIVRDYQRSENALPICGEFSTMCSHGQIKRRTKAVASFSVRRRPAPRVRRGDCASLPSAAKARARYELRP